jgi:hypothetical protein
MDTFNSGKAVCSKKKRKKYIYNVEFKVLTAIFMKTDII